MTSLNTIITEANATAKEVAPQFTGYSIETLIAASIKLSRVYYEIAVEAIGEPAVKAKRDGLMERLTHTGAAYQLGKVIK
jgi:hypothetical protein